MKLGELAKSTNC